MARAGWNTLLEGRIHPDWAEEIDQFEAQLELRRQGKIDEKVFAETRLRRGVYGQRYDNGKRHDGYATRELPFADKPTKGPDTAWDAPGMQRIKLPFGGLSPEQLDVVADLAEEYADEILHVTTRQDFQLHFVHIEDTPDLMRRLAAVGVTTREACGNSVRNVTACPLAGVCHTEAFDVSPYARAMMEFLLGHPDVQDFGRKFKPAFSGCEGEACGLVQMHDAGYVAKVVDGRLGFKVVVGGGLGTVPHQAEVLSEFTPVEELLVEIQAISRVFARLGEKKNRNRARIKFLVAQLGIDEFRRLVDEEKRTIPHDPRHTALVGEDLPITGGAPVRDPDPLDGAPRPEGFVSWYDANVLTQRQEGYCVVTVHLPIGDLTSQQARGLADVARRFAGDNLRTTVDQNIVLRFVSEADLPAVYADLGELGLALPGAGTIVDVTACPGTDTCKLGIASSRGLAGELRTRLAAKSASLDQAVSELSIKISGCFNSCAQHHIADIGFYGNARGFDGRRVPHFQVVLGGQRHDNAAKYGKGVGAVPSKHAPEVVDALTDAYVHGRGPTETFQQWADRMGKRELRNLLEPFMTGPSFDEDPDFYADFGDARQYTVGDLGVGECAGEVVSLFGIEVVRAESEVFDAQVALDEANDPDAAEDHAYRAMLFAARALVRTEFIDVTEDPDDIVNQWKTRFFDTERFFDRFAKGKFGRYLLDRHADPTPSGDPTLAAHRIEEAQLFIEAAHSCEARIAAEAAAIPQGPVTVGTGSA
jgi:sulfite reductase (ferredoxin)